MKPFNLVVVLVSLLLGARDFAQSTDFLRIHYADGGIGEFQTAIVSYRNENKVTVDLVSAVHIAEAYYYQSLNQLFDRYDAVLYELVAPADTRPDTGQRSGHPISAIQRQMKDTLLLSFQLDEIDYSPNNFFHADLDPQGLEDAMDARGENGFTLLLKMMSVQNSGGGPILNNATMLAALISADPNNSLKYLFAKEMINQTKSAFTELGSDEGLALIVDRNKAAVASLQSMLNTTDFQHYAIFYGVGHMPGLENLLSELGFYPTGERKWLSAWDFYGLEIDPKQ